MLVAAVAVIVVSIGVIVAVTGRALAPTLTTPGRTEQKKKKHLAGGPVGVDVPAATVTSRERTPP